MEVGPSAPPMMPMDAASLMLKVMPGTTFSARAPRSAPKMPNWAAAPRRAVRGFASMGPKSVMAPTPMKMRHGNTPDSMPTM